MTCRVTAWPGHTLPVVVPYLCEQGSRKQPSFPVAGSFLPVLAFQGVTVTSLPASAGTAHPARAGELSSVSQHSQVFHVWTGYSSRHSGATDSITGVYFKIPQYIWTTRLMLCLRTVTPTYENRVKGKGLTPRLMRGFVQPTDWNGWQWLLTNCSLVINCFVSMLKYLR